MGPCALGQKARTTGLHTYGFIQNAGQIQTQDGQQNTDVEYILLRPGLNVQVRNDGFSYDTYIVESQGGGKWNPKTAKSADRPQDVIKYHRVDISFPGANAAEIIATNPAGDKLRYIKSLANLTANHYESILYRNIYDGIDLKLYTNEAGAFEYDFVVRPGASPDLIRMNFKGQDKLARTGARALGLSLSHGELREEIPASYIASTRKNVDVTFKLGIDNEVSFNVPEYDRRETLVIDPSPTLIWATYYGGEGEDSGESVSSDGSGNLYYAGYTASLNGADIIATAGTFQTSYQGGYDGFVVKFDFDGVRQFGTYFGGGGEDAFYGVLADEFNGAIYATGYSSSAGMATGGTAQESLGGSTDVIIVRFNDTGNLVWSSYFGGANLDAAYDITLDGNSNPVVAGRTQTTSGLPMTPGWQTNYGGGDNDGLIVGFNGPAGFLQFSSYVGGPDDEGCVKLISDGANNLHVVGWTNSTSGIATGSSHQTNVGGGYDAFLIKYSGDGTKQWGTYYGGSTIDEGYGVGIDGSGNVYICGYTTSNFGISTSGSHQDFYTPGGTNGADGFIAKFNPFGIRQWGTYYGGDADDILWTLVGDDSFVFVAGQTESASGIATSNAYQTSPGGGKDAVLAKFSSFDGFRIWGSYYGGTDTDGAMYNTVVGNNFVISGYTFSYSGIAQSGHQGGQSLNADGFLASFEDGDSSIPVTPRIASVSPLSGPVGSDVTLYGSGFSVTPTDNTVYFGATRALVTFATPTQLQVTVPDGSTFLPITVTNPGGMTGASSQPFVVTVPGSDDISSTSFAPKQDVNIGASPTGIVVADFGTDGKPDVAESNGGVNSIGIFVNASSPGSLNLPSASFLPAGSSPQTAVVVDWDGDGMLDIVATNEFSSNTTIYRNAFSGGISFDSGISFSSTSPTVPAVGDIDGDGKPDLAVTNINENTVALFLNTSTPGLVSASFIGTVQTGGAPRGIQLADVTYDGKPDIVVANSGSNTVSVVRNTSSGPGAVFFDFKDDFPTNSTPWMVAVADFDLDGLQDIAVSCTSSGVISYLLNTTISGVLSFAIKVDGPAGFGVTGIATDDLDGDGYPDIVAANSDANTVSVIKNNSTSGSLLFNVNNEFSTGFQPYYSVAIVDIDGDGKKDILVPNSGESSFSILLNQIPVTILEPPDQAQNFELLNATSSSLDIRFTGATSRPDGYVAVAGFSGPTSFIPQDGVAYNVGDSFGNDFIISVGSDTTFTDSGLNSSTTYYYDVYAYNGAGSSINYNQNNPLHGEPSTTGLLAPEPNFPPTNLNATNPTASTLLISFDAALDDPDGYIVLRAPGAAPDSPPVDGVSYSVDLTIGSGTVAYIGPAATFEDNDLSPSTTYFYAVYSFNGSGDLTNYLDDPLEDSGATNNTPLIIPSDFGTVDLSTEDDILTVRFINATTVFAAGAGGTMRKSTNGGTSWVSLPPPTTLDIWDMEFTSTTSGIAVGELGLVMLTTDGGDSWTEVLTPTNATLYNVQMLPGTQTGYAVGEEGEVIKTINGGASWTILPDAPAQSGSYYSGLHFKNVDEGLISGPRGVFKTTNGGDTWFQFSTDGILWYSFPNSIAGYGVGVSGLIIKSIDGGDTWFEQVSPTVENLWNVHFVNASVGFATGSAGVILKTTNGGSAWNLALEAATERVYAVHFGSSANGVAVGLVGYVGKAQIAPPPITLTKIANPTIDANTTEQVSVQVAGTNLNSRHLAGKFYSIALKQDAAGNPPGAPTVPVLSNNQYSGTLSNIGNPEQVGYKYWFEVSYDPEFGRTVSTTETFIHVRYPDGSLQFPNFRTGEDEKAYQLISIPVQLEDAKVATVFGPENKKEWRLYSATSTGSGSSLSTANTEMQATQSLIPGKGYWFITKNQKVITLDAGAAPAVTAADPFTLPLTTGYNVIGNPYNFDVPWEEGTDVGELKYYNNGSWSAPSSMEPFKGYIVRVTTGGAYEVPLAGPFNGGRTKRMTFDQNASSWRLDIDLEQGGMSNLLGKIGMHPKATLGMDIADEEVFNMPDFVAVPSLSISRPEVELPLEKDFVPSAANQTWEFTLRSKEDDSPVTMSWDRALIASLGRDLYLFDEEAISLIDMSTIGSYQARSNKPMKIITGDPLFLRSQVTFGESRIGALYPNPASGGFFVPVAMREAGEVQVRVLDLKGAEIASQLHFAEVGMQNLSISGLPEGLQGLFLVTTETVGSGRKVQKIIFK